MLAQDKPDLPVLVDNLVPSTTSSKHQFLYWNLDRSAQIIRNLPEAAPTTPMVQRELSAGYCRTALDTGIDQALYCVWSRSAVPYKACIRGYYQWAHQFQ